MEEFDEGPEFVVQGYQFEPLSVNQTVEYSSGGSIDEEDVDDQSPLVPLHGTLTGKICIKNCLASLSQ